MLGVSQSSVSRAFTPGANVSSAMRELILGEAARLGYRPNAIASSLSKRAGNLIGIVLPDLRNPFYPAFLEKLLLALEHAGHQGLVVNGAPNGDMSDGLARLTQYNIDTAIVASARVSVATILEWTRGGRFALLLNRAIVDAPVASVGCNDAAGARTMADHFYACGYRKAAYVGGLTNAPANLERRNAFSARLAELGMTLSACVDGGSYRYEVGYRSAIEAARSGAEAIFFANDIVALGGLDALRDEAGLRVPDDICVAGFDDIAMASWPRYRLTTIRQPLDAMIVRAMEILAERMASLPLNPVAERIAGELIVRATTAPRAHRR